MCSDYTLWKFLSQAAWVPISALPFPVSVNLGKSLNLSGPQCPRQ